MGVPARLEGCGVAPRFLGAGWELVPVGKASVAASL